MSALSVTDLPFSRAPQGVAELVAAVTEGEDWARAALYDRYASDVARVLHAVLGPDQEIADLIQDTFIEVFDAIGTLRDVDALRGFIRQIAVNVARSSIRKRRRMRWLHVFGLVDVVEPAAVVAPPEARQALAETYRVLGEMSVDLRVAFTLRHVEGLEVTQVASACGVSLATIKRRLVAAEESFRRHARRGGKLDEWLEPGGRFA